MKSNLRGLVTAFTAATAVAVGVVALLRSDAVRLHTVTVVVERANGEAGAPRVAEAHVRHLADLREGTSMLALDLSHAAQGIRRHPWVQDVTIHRGFPDSVTLSVVERAPRAVLVHEGLWFVDPNGNLVTQVDGPVPDLPLVTGLPESTVKEQPAIARRIVREAVALLDASAQQPDLRQGRISEVNFNPHGGFTVVLANGSEIFLGFRSFQEPLAQLRVLAQNGVTFTDSPVRVDLGIPSQAVVSPLMTPRSDVAPLPSGT